jgi:hypothetical protein
MNCETVTPCWPFPAAPVVPVLGSRDDDEPPLLLPSISAIQLLLLLLPLQPAGLKQLTEV